MNDLNLIRNGKLPLLVAHRGYCGANIPCNSRSAYLAAITFGADVVELDVSKSRDGVLFAFHPYMEHAQTDKKRPIQVLKAKTVKRKLYLNQDNTKTAEGILTLDEAFDILKGHCLVNIDKFWTEPKLITECVRRHGMENQVIIKTPVKESYFADVEKYAPDLPYMVMAGREDDITEKLLKRNINLVAIETHFKSDSDQSITDEHIAWLHSKGIAVWGNAIVYDYHNVLAAGHSDDAAVAGDPDFGWGYFVEKGFDLVQTDWLSTIKSYYEKKYPDKV